MCRSSQQPLYMRSVLPPIIMLMLIAQCAHAAPDPSVLSTWCLSFKLPIRTPRQSYEVRQGNGPIQLQYWPSLGTTSTPFRNVKRHFCRCKNHDALLLLNQLSTLHTKRLNLFRKGLASYCKAETTFTFLFSILTLSNGFLGIDNRATKSESGFSFAIASQPFKFAFLILP